jgi:hypothetical protein
MLFLLIACAAGVYLWHTAPALLLFFGSIVALWGIIALPWALFVGLSRFVNALPAWRWLTAESLVPAWCHRFSFRNDWVFYGFLGIGTLALLAEYVLRAS